MNSVTENKEKIAQLEEFIKASMEEIKLLLINQQNSVKQWYMIYTLSSYDIILIMVCIREKYN